MNELFDYFVSYNRFDRDWAEWIAWQLEEAGYSTVIQAWDFRAGTNFVLEMDKAASRSQHTIAVLSPDYLQSKFGATEWAASFANDASGVERRLIPVRVRPVELSGLLNQIVHIDLVNLGENAAREALLTGIRTGRTKPTQQPQFPGAIAHEDSDAPSFPGQSQKSQSEESQPAYSVLDEVELLEHALAWIPPTHRGHSAGRLGVIVAGGPRRVLIRPARLESEELREQIMQRAVFGITKVFDLEAGSVEHQISNDTLILSQPDGTIVLDENATLGVFQLVDRKNVQGEMRGLLDSSVLIEEEILDRLQRALRFVRAMLDEFDPQSQITSIAVVAALLDVGHRAWRTREEHRASPNMVSHSRLVSDDHTVVKLSPAVQPRESLSTEFDAIVEDLLVRLRRRHMSG